MAGGGGGGNVRKSEADGQSKSKAASTTFSSLKPPSSSNSCTDSPLETQRAQLRSLLCQRYTLLIFYTFFLVPHQSFSPVELCGCCIICSSHICYRETWYVCFNPRSNTVTHLSTVASCDLLIDFVAGNVHVTK